MNSFAAERICPARECKSAPASSALAFAVSKNSAERATRSAPGAGCRGSVRHRLIRPMPTSAEAIGRTMQKTPGKPGTQSKRSGRVCRGPGLCLAPKVLQSPGHRFLRLLDELIFRFGGLRQQVSLETGNRLGRAQPIEVARQPLPSFLKVALQHVQIRRGRHYIEPPEGAAVACRSRAPFPLACRKKSVWLRAPCP